MYFLRSRLTLIGLISVFSLPSGFAQITTQESQPKEALLIANGDYAHFGRLPNPISDAHLLGDSLQKIGFHVTLIENATREGMLDALQSFQDTLKSSHGIAFFHYGGHGVQVSGRNFLIPADADIPDERKVSTRAVDLEEVMTTLDASGASVNIVVLDACRDNPLPATVSRSATRGLSVVQTKPKNTLIVYAAEPGSKAEDGLFTPSLASALIEPGKSISQVIKEVRRTVFQKSNGNQTPGEYDQLFEDVYLAGDASSLPPTQPTPPNMQMPVMPSVKAPVENDRVSIPQNAMPASSNPPRDAMQGVILKYHQAIQDQDEATVRTLLPDQLDYYKSGRVPMREVLADIKGDWKRYSTTTYQVSEFQTINDSSCRYVLDYSLAQGTKIRKGKLLMTATISIPDQKISSLKATVVSAH
jgi:hypothetical protein